MLSSLGALRSGPLPRIVWLLRVRLWVKRERAAVTCVTSSCDSGKGAGLSLTSDFMRRRRKKTVGIMVLVAGVLALGPGPVPGQVRKTCEGGVTLRLNTGVTAQGSLLFVEVAGTKPFAEFAGDWDGRAIPLWREAEKPGTLHGLIGVDLEKAPGRYAWKVSWKNAAGEAKSCSALVTVRAGKFPTERLTVEEQFVQPDPEQEKRAEEDQKKMRAIFETVTPERYWDGKFQLP